MGPTTFDVYIWGFVETQKWFWWTFNKTTPDLVSLRAGCALVSGSGEWASECAGLMQTVPEPGHKATEQSRPEQREQQKSQHISYFIYYLERVRCINQIRNEYDITTPKSTSVSVPVGVAVPVLQLQPQLQPQDCDSVSDSNWDSVCEFDPSRPAYKPKMKINQRSIWKKKQKKMFPHVHNSYMYVHITVYPMETMSMR